MRLKRDSIESRTDAAAMRSARRCLEIIEPLLQRPEEAGEALREFYQAIREELTTTPQKGQAP